MSTTIPRYFRTGPITQDKIDTILKQIDDLERSNRELTIKINVATVNLNVNQAQIELLKEILNTCMDVLRDGSLSSRDHATFGIFGA